MSSFSRKTRPLSLRYQAGNTVLLLDTSSLSSALSPEYGLRGFKRLCLEVPALGVLGSAFSTQSCSSTSHNLCTRAHRDGPPPSAVTSNSIDLARPGLPA